MKFLNIAVRTIAVGPIWMVMQRFGMIGQVTIPVPSKEQIERLDQISHEGVNWFLAFIAFVLAAALIYQWFRDDREKKEASKRDREELAASRKRQEELMEEHKRDYREISRQNTDAINRLAALAERLNEEVADTRTAAQQASRSSEEAKGAAIRGENASLEAKRAIEDARRRTRT